MQKIISEKIAFMLKTYAADYDNTVRLVDTFIRHNKDLIKLYIVVDKPDADRFTDAFSKLDDRTIHVIDKADIGTCFFVSEPILGISPGYINQEIVKLTFWKLGFSENYLCLDSDGYFIRDFYVDDFIAEDGFPYTVLEEDKSLEVSDYYYNNFWKERQKKLDIIKKEMGLVGRHILTNHNCQVFNASVLEEFESRFMRLKDYSYARLMEISPYEFAWYNYFLQKTQVIPIHLHRPYFKMYHMAYQQIADVLQGIDEDHIATEYIGIVLNSNYSAYQGRQLDDIAGLSWNDMNSNSFDAVKSILNKKTNNYIRKNTI